MGKARYGLMEIVRRNEIEGIVDCVKSRLMAKQPVVVVYEWESELAKDLNDLEEQLQKCEDRHCKTVMDLMVGVAGKDYLEPGLHRCEEIRQAEEEMVVNQVIGTLWRVEKEMLGRYVEEEADWVEIVEARYGKVADVLVRQGLWLDLSKLG